MYRKSTANTNENINTVPLFAKVKPMKSSRKGIEYSHHIIVCGWAPLSIIIPAKNRQKKTSVIYCFLCCQKLGNKVSGLILRSLNIVLHCKNLVNNIVFKNDPCKRVSKIKNIVFCPIELGKNPHSIDSLVS
jgi:hypothetical protein